MIGRLLLMENFARDLATIDKESTFGNLTVIIDLQYIPLFVHKILQTAL